MPSLKFKERLNSNLAIGVQVGAFVDGRGYKDKHGRVTQVGRGVWTAEIKFPGEKAIFRTTKVKYEPESRYSKEEATRRAYEIFAGFSDRYGRGLDVSSVNYVTTLLDRYVREAEENTEVNRALTAKGLEPRHIMWGGRNPWRKESYEHMERQIRLYIYPFAKEKLPTIGREQLSRIENVKKRDWDQLDGWLLKNNPRMSIESRLKIISECRKFLSWCYEREFIEDVPSIKRPARGGVQGARNRMRKEIDQDTYKRIIQYTRERYLDRNKSEYHRDYAYLFHLWILIMANTGIRTPGGDTEHTLIKWEHVRLPTGKSKREIATLLRPNEKGHTYEAIIMPRAITYIRQLKEFYRKRKISTRSGYLFKHPHPSYYGRNHVTHAGEIKIRAGDPILSFRTQWRNMAKKLELHEFGTKEAPVPQSERISPSSLRAWFITQRLYSDKQVKIELLARCTGTSIGQIETRYLRLDMDKSYEHLTAGAYDDGDAEQVFIDGFYAGTKDSLYWREHDLNDYDDFTVEQAQRELHELEKQAGIINIEDDGTQSA